MIKLQDIKVSFNNRCVIQRTTFVFETGSYYLLRGNTGSGKTTLLKLISGLLKADSGHISYHFGDHSDLNTPPKIGYISQEPQLQIFFPTIADEISFGLLNAQLEKKEVELRLSYWLEILNSKFGIDRQKSVYALSGGQQQIISLASTFALEPKILLLDEPTSMLDDWNTSLIREFLEFYRDKHPEMIVIHSTHEQSVSPIKPDLTLYLEKGHLTIADRTSNNISSNSNNIIVFSSHLSSHSTFDYLSVKNVGYYFKGCNFIFRNISFNVTSGDLIIIFGKNGSGKSTLIDLLWRWEKPTEGEIITKTIKIGIVLQNTSETLIWEYVKDEFIRTYPNYSWSPESIEKHLSVFGLSNMLERKTKELSGGEKRLLAIALATVEQPDLLILDEPFLGLDNKKRQELVTLINKWRVNGKAIIYTANRKSDIIADSTQHIDLDINSSNMN